MKKLFLIAVCLASTCFAVDSNKEYELVCGGFQAAITKACGNSIYSDDFSLDEVIAKFSGMLTIRIAIESHFKTHPFILKDLNRLAKNGDSACSGLLLAYEEFYKTTLFGKERLQKLIDTTKKYLNCDQSNFKKIN